MALTLSLAFDAVVQGPHADPSPPQPLLSFRSQPFIPMIDAIMGAGQSAQSLVGRRTLDDASWTVAPCHTLEEDGISLQPGSFGVMLSSPFFEIAHDGAWQLPLKNPNGSYEGKEAVREALAAIATKVHWAASERHPFCVFIGRSYAAGGRFSLEEQKRIVMLVCRFEAAIDTLPQTQRTGRHVILSNCHDSESLKEAPSMDVICKLIQDAEDENALSELMNDKPTPTPTSIGQWRRNYKFKVVFPKYLHRYMIGFRQRSATVSADEAVAWALFILDFVNYAIDPSTDPMAGEATLDYLRGRGIRVPQV